MSRSIPKVVVEFPDGSPVKFADVQFTEWRGDELHVCVSLGEHAPPEVIEGRGQRVEKRGWYCYEDPHFGVCYDEKIPGGEDGAGVFAKGVRYIKATPPTFPPRPAFVAPPKPEQFLVRYKDREEHWTTCGADCFICMTSGRKLAAIHCVVLDPLTGKPAEEAKG